LLMCVTYLARVEVEIDLEGGEILDVNVIDDELDGPLQVFDEDLRPVLDARRGRALQIMGEVDWSGWTFGC
jgi:hypothetical protein